MRRMSSLFAVLVVAAVPAQSELCGFLRFGAVSAATRGGVGTQAGQLLMRFDASDYHGLGTGGNGTLLAGFQVVVQEVGSGPIATQFHVYGESAATADFPTQPGAAAPGASALFSSGSITIPGSGASTAMVVTTTFLTPLAMPAGDVFVGVEVSAAPAFPAAGLAVQVGLAQPGGLPMGPGVLEQGSYLLSHVPGGVFAYSATPQQMAADLAVPAGTLRAVALAAVLTTSTAPLLTGSFLVGLHPDAASPPLNAGRLDDVGIVLLGAAAGDLVTWVLDVGPAFAASPLPLANVLPGSSGFSCLATVTVAALGAASGTAQDEVFWSFSPLQRARMRGLDLRHQAIVLTPSFTARASACVRQRL